MTNIYGLFGRLEVARGPRASPTTNRERSRTAPLRGRDIEALRLSLTPDLGAVQVRLGEADRFFHARPDTTIDHNVTWSEERAFHVGDRISDDVGTALGASRYLS